MVTNAVYTENVFALKTEKITFPIVLIADIAHISLILTARFRWVAVNSFYSTQKRLILLILINK